jgi:hypothetical protein
VREAPCSGDHHFFFWLLSFPNRIDVWGRLCTHFETVKVMTFSSGTCRKSYLLTYLLSSGTCPKPMLFHTLIPKQITGLGVHAT